MGSIWLSDLDAVIKSAGLKMRTWQGWQTRSRSAGGYERLWAIFCHHTASNTSPDNDCRYQWESADSRPIGALHLARDGLITVGAAGATNTQGKGGPVATSNGTIPLDRGNDYGLAIEAANDGVGEVWPTVQQDAYVKLVAALCERYGLDPRRDVFAHHEWAAGRKSDPAGNSRFASGTDKWDMETFRREAAETAKPPEPKPEDEEMMRIAASASHYWLSNNIHVRKMVEADAIQLIAREKGKLVDHRSGRIVQTIADVSSIAESELADLGSLVPPFPA